MMKLLPHLTFFAVTLLASTLAPALARAQNPSPAPQRLWPGDAPGALGKTPEDIPTLTPYLPLPALATGAAMVVCPGGGYAGLATAHEGTAYAQWLNRLGIAAFVLKYRLGPRGYRHPVMLQDAARALRTVRAQAVQWQVDPQRIGIMGSSAGGHLASTLLTHFDVGNPNATDPIERQSSRPTLGVLCYPVITMGQYTHGGSRQNLLGDNPPPELVRLLSNELQVTPQTPPTFVWHTADDNVVPVENSLDFAAALHRNKVPFELRIYPHGAHGLGLGDDTPPFRNALPWTNDLCAWLKSQKFAHPLATLAHPYAQTSLVPTSEVKPQPWRYTLTAPQDDAWTQPTFSDIIWQQGAGAFGQADGVLPVGTLWTSPDIWLRRTVTLPPGDYANAKFRVFHDEDVEIYINGVLAARAGGYTTNYALLDIAPEARALLKAGANTTLAVHCHQTAGGQGVDVGLVGLDQA